MKIQANLDAIAKEPELMRKLNVVLCVLNKIYIPDMGG